MEAHYNPVNTCLLFFIYIFLHREEAEGRSSSDMLAEVLHDSMDDVFMKESVSLSGSSPTPGGQGKNYILKDRF